MLLGEVLGVHTTTDKGCRFRASMRPDESLRKVHNTVQVSLAELKQEVKAAKSLSNSAAVVLQTNAGLQNVQHKLIAPRTAALSTSSSINPEINRHVPSVPTMCEGGPAPADKAPMQWLATGVSTDKLSPQLYQQTVLHAQGVVQICSRRWQGWDTAVRLPCTKVPVHVTSLCWAHQSGHRNGHAEHGMNVFHADGLGPGNAAG